MPYKDKNKRLEYQRKYHREHKKERKERDREYIPAHKEERRLQRQKYNREQIIAHKEFTSRFHTACQHCGTTKDLCFHHVDPSTKLYEVSQMELKRRELVVQELAKCISLCRSCHSKLHGKLRRGKK